MAYSELIKSFEKIRSYLRDFYIFGFRSRSDYDRKSPRSYDNERRRAESWLGDSVSFRQDSGGKSVFISVDSRETAHNLFYRAFKAASFTDRDITLHFHILDLLADGKALPAGTIAEQVSERCRAVSEKDFLPDDSTVRTKLKEYVSLGILKEEKQGREILYSRSDMEWDRGKWLDAIAFASEGMPLGVTGSFLLDKYPETPEYFSFKHHYLIEALDSEILSEILECRAERRNALITFTGRHGENAHQALVYPLKVYVSMQSGRENLLAYSFQARRPKMYRLDRIRSVKMMDPQPEQELLDAAGEKFARFLWGTSGGSNRDRTVQHLEMKIHAEDSEPFIPQRLEREKRGGTVTRLDANTWLFAADVYDAHEMIPWIRTFTGRIISLSCSDREVVRRFYEDLEEMYGMYGGDGCDL